MQVGDKVYRYKFDLASGKKSVDVFEVSDVDCGGTGRETFKCARTDDGKLAMQGVYFGAWEFGKVKTKGTSKYVMLDHDDMLEALSLVMDYVEEVLVEIRGKMERARSWMDILESWTKEML